MSKPVEFSLDQTSAILLVAARAGIFSTFAGPFFRGLFTNTYFSEFGIDQYDLGRR